jgi:HSP20 family protein
MTAALRFDPFRELDRWANEMMGAARTPRLMPLDVYRHGESYVVKLDCPGIDAESLDVTAENSTLTIRAERKADAPEGAQFVVAERPSGLFTRQMVLGDGLNLEAITADYRDGVLTVTIPVAEQAKPRRIEIGRGGDRHEGHKMISGTSRATGDQQAESTPAGARG